MGSIACLPVPGRSRLTAFETIAMQKHYRKPIPFAPPKIDPAAVKLMKTWLSEFPADEVRHYARTGTPAVRTAAIELLSEMIGGRDG